MMSTTPSIPRASLKRSNPDWPYIDDVGSNLDMSIDGDVAALLSRGNCRAHYAAWNWNGTVFHDDDGWHVEVWRYHSHVATFTDETLHGAIGQAVEEYGAE